MAQPSTLRLVTCNVRYDGLSSHPVPIPRNGTIQAPRRHWTLESPYEERPWAERRSRLVDALMFWGPDIIGFQEVLHNQLLDLQALLGPTWASVGVGRDDGRTSGEYSPIFFNTEKFERIAWGTKWLSKHPNEPGSKDWDAAQTRIATFLTLRPTSTPGLSSSSSSNPHSPSQSAYEPIPDRNLIHLVNTHYDDQGKRSRGEASLLIRGLMRGWVEMNERNGVRKEEEEGRGLVVWMGDFNAPTDDPKETGYSNAVSPLPLPHSQGGDVYFLDTRLTLDHRRGSSRGWKMNAPYGHNGTYTGFKQPGSEVDDPIDLVLVARARSGDEVKRKETGTSGAVRPGRFKLEEIQDERESDDRQDEEIRGGWTVERYGVIDNLIAGKGDESGWVGRWSDHRAVGVELARKG